MSAIGLPEACERLIAMYDVTDWWPARSRFEVMVGAVLVQNTRWSNVAAAIASLRRQRCLNPAKIAALKSADLCELIRPAGCQRVKSKRLRALATWVEQSGGIRALQDMPLSELRAGLLDVHGVGPETADAILCFAFGQRCFVADAYARRWIQRVGVAGAPARMTYAACRTFVEDELADIDMDLGALHAAIVMHAQTRCRPNPECIDCALRAACGDAQ